MPSIRRIAPDRGRNSYSSPVGTHDHRHHHHHHPDPGTESSGRIAQVFFLNAGFALIELIGGLLTNSTAILADAVHDLGDSLALGMAWLLERFSRRHPDRDFTYGYRRLSLFGALINSALLVAGSIWVLALAIPRLADPVMPVTEGMIGLALLGVAVNGVAAWRISAGKTLNERALSWHLMEDVLGWVAVLIVAIVLQFADWPILDPLLSLAFTLFILFNVSRTMWSTIKLFFQAVPDREMLARIERALTELPGIETLHDLHLWSLDGQRHVLTVHIVLGELARGDSYARVKARIGQALAPFELASTTIEIEQRDEDCRDASTAGPTGGSLV